MTRYFLQPLRMFGSMGMAVTLTCQFVTSSIGIVAEGAEPAPAAPGLISSFVGVEDALRNGPASAQIAVGPTEIVQAVTSLFRITNKIGGSSGDVDPRELFDDFYATHPRYTDNPAISAPTNPTAVFDHFSNRFVIVWNAVDYSSTESVYLIQISKTANPREYSDPTQNWILDVQRSDVNFGSGSPVDTAEISNDVRIGFDKTNYYITSNQISKTGQFKSSKIRVFAKQQFNLPVAEPIRYFDYLNVKDGVNALAFSIRPCVTFGTPGKEYLVSAAFPAGNLVTLYSITGTWPNPTDSPPLLKIEATIPFNPWDAPKKMNQPSSSVLIDGGDARLLNAVYRNGVVYTGQSLKNKSFSCAAGIKSIDVLRKVKLLDQVIGAVNESYSFPAVTADAKNNVYAVFNRSSKLVCAECRYTALKYGETDFRVSKILKIGTTPYTAYNGAWGRYNGIAIDPNEEGAWVNSMFAQVNSVSRSSSYGTWVGNVSEPTIVSGTNEVIANYNDLNKTLTLTGDAAGNKFTVSYSNQGYSNPLIKITADPGTFINGKASDSFAVSAGQIVVEVDLGAGFDVLTMIGVNCSVMGIALGSGDDRCDLDLCAADSLNLDGGLGTDVVITTTSRFLKRNIVGVP